MTRPLRRAHYRIWLILAVLLPAVFVAGMLTRRSATPANPHLHWEHYK